MAARISRIVRWANSMKGVSSILTPQLASRSSIPLKVRASSASSRVSRPPRIEPELWAESGACGAGTLHAFGLMFAGRNATTTFREAPFGVGYLLAQTA